jgi:molecular chaperone HtpG
VIAKLACPFHFFKKFDRKVTGTSITLNLKKEYDNYSSTDYINYVKDKFRYIEFPIIIECDGETIEIFKQEFEEKKLKERINDSLRHQYKSVSENIEIFTYNFQNKEYEGAISLLYLKDYSFRDVNYFMNDTLFKSAKVYNRNMINISQKGVLINNDDDIVRYSDIYCNLNLKEKVELQISRNNFSDNIETSKIVNEILKELSFSFFEKLNRENSPEILSKISFNFIEKDFINFQEEMYSKLFLSINDPENIYNHINYQEFLNKKLNTFVISFNNENTLFLNSKIKKLNIIELFIENENAFYHRINNSITIFKNNNYTEVLVKKEDFYYLELIKDFSETQKMSFMKSYSFIYTKNINTIYIDIDKLLCTSNNSEFQSFEIELNKNHPFVKAIFSYQESDLNKKTKELINEIFQIITNIYGELGDEKFNSIKELENELKKNIVMDYELSLSDFVN